MVIIIMEIINCKASLDEGYVKYMSNKIAKVCITLADLFNASCTLWEVIFMNFQITYKKADKVLRNNGFVYDKCKGSHHQYVKDGVRVVVNNRINPCVWNRLVKENNLAV